MLRLLSSLLFEAGKVYTGLVNPKSVDWASALFEEFGNSVLFTKGRSSHSGKVRGLLGASSVNW
jgi:hypothetical protein